MRTNNIEDFLNDYYDPEKQHKDIKFIIDSLKEIPELRSSLPEHIMDLEELIKQKKIYINSELFALLDKTDSLLARDEILDLLVFSKKDKEKVAEFICNELIKYEHIPISKEIESYLWFLCDKLFSLKVKKLIDMYHKIAQISSFGKQRQLLILLIGKIGDTSSIPLLIELTEDKTVDGHALDALCNFNDHRVIEVAKRFVDDKRTWVCKKAKKKVMLGVVIL